MDQFKLTVQLTPYMIDVLNDPHRFQVLTWHRKARKTTLAIYQLARWASRFPYAFWYVSPSYGLAKRTIWEEPNMLPQLFGDEWDNANSEFIHKRETDTTIEFKQSKGMLYLLGSDRPELMRGPNPYGVIIDEAAIQKPEVWTDVIQPIMLTNPKAWCWFLSTPHGKNYYYTLHQYGERGEKDWHSSLLPATQSGIFTEEQLAEARKVMTPGAYQQELMCQFLEGEGSVFRNVRAVMTLYKEQDKQLGHLYVMGVDLAKHTDWTVVVVYDRQTNQQVYQDRWQKLDWPYQKAKIASIARNYNDARVILDATGVGDPIADDLLRSGIAVTPIKFTNQTKKELIEKLMIWIDQRKFAMLVNPDTLQEFEDYGYDMTATGITTYNAPQGKHDDIVIAHALAISDLYELTKSAIVDKDASPVQRDFQRLIAGDTDRDRDSQQWLEWYDDGEF